MRVATGTYTGNGTSQSIVISDGVASFQPDFVQICGGSQIDQVTTSTMGADATKPITGSTAPGAGKITSLNADGFSVGSGASVNGNTVVFYYLAVKNNGAGDCAVGTYVGDGNNPGPIINVGFQPTMFYIIPTNTAQPRFGSSVQSTNPMQPLNGGPVANSLQLTATGASIITTSVLINTSGLTYHYFAFKNTLVSKIMSYASNDIAGTNVTGVGFTPKWAFVNGIEASGAGVTRENNMVGDTSNPVDVSAPAANNIQAFVSDGVTVGNSTNVNATATAAHYMLWAMTAGVTLGPGGGGTGGKGKGGGKGGGTGTPKPPGKLKTFGTGHWRWGDGRRWG